MENKCLLTLRCSGKQSRQSVHWWWIHHKCGSHQLEGRFGRVPGRCRMQNHRQCGWSIVGWKRGPRKRMPRGQEDKRKRSCCQKIGTVWRESEIRLYINKSALKWSMIDFILAFEVLISNLIDIDTYSDCSKYKQSTNLETLKFKDN